MKNQIENISTSMTLADLANKIRLLSGVLTMALGLILFVLWFGWSMNVYLGNIERSSGSSNGLIVASSSSSPASLLKVSE